KRKSSPFCSHLWRKTSVANTPTRRSEEQRGARRSAIEIGLRCLHRLSFDGEGTEGKWDPSSPFPRGGCFFLAFGSDLSFSWCFWRTDRIRTVWGKKWRHFCVFLREFFIWRTMFCNFG
ncbi:unnamed protein product, partial [Musa textilis]